MNCSSWTVNPAGLVQLVILSIAGLGFVILRRILRFDSNEPLLIVYFIPSC